MKTYLPIILVIIVSFSILQMCGSSGNILDIGLDSEADRIFIKNNSGTIVILDDNGLISLGQDTVYHITFTGDTLYYKIINRTDTISK